MQGLGVLLTIPQLFPVQFMSPMSLRRHERYPLLRLLDSRLPDEGTFGQRYFRQRLLHNFDTANTAPCITCEA